MSRLTVLITLALMLTAPPIWAEAYEEQTITPGDLQPTIAIIIDDMGHNPVEGQRLVQLDQPITLAFLPYRRYTTRLANQAHKHDKEVMLHAPMDNTRQIGLGAGGLTADMERDDIVRTLRRALQAIPHVEGVNNHMGSLLTQMPEPMGWIMEELHNYPLYFVDSRTIATSIAGQTAALYRIPTATRDVFLDHEQDEAYVDAQFQLLVEKARQNGTAIGIGHPHRVTVDYLEKALPRLDEQGIAVATVSAVWAIRNDNRHMFADGEKQPISPVVARKN